MTDRAPAQPTSRLPPPPRADSSRVPIRLIRKLACLKNLVAKELHSPLKTPLRKRFKAWRLGFLSSSAAIYGFDKYRPSDYLNDFARFMRTPFINDPYGVLLDDKLAFHAILQPHGEYLPRLFGTVRRGRIATPDGGFVLRAQDWLRAILDEHGALLLKPCDSGGGAGVCLAEGAPAGVSVNGQPASLPEFAGWVEKLEGYLLMERVIQADYAARIFPAAANTFRLHVLWDTESGKPFVAAAVHRFGTSLTQPTDAWSRGGLAAGVDVETGVLGRANSYAFAGRALWHETHPETAARIAGVEVPRWRETTETMLTVAATYPHLPYVGWDILMTNDSFRIIEGNSYSGSAFVQVQKPLLIDDRVRRFYRKHGVI